MTPCERLGYNEGDLFEVIDYRDHDYTTKGMILRFTHDDGTDYPGFEYVSGNTATYTESVGVIYVNLECVKKLQKSIAPEIDKTDKPDKTTEVTYSIQDIEAAFEHLNWLDSSKDILLEALKVVTDNEYKEYLRLKQKYETK